MIRAMVMTGLTLASQAKATGKTVNTFQPLQLGLVAASACYATPESWQTRSQVIGFPAFVRLILKLKCGSDQLELFGQEYRLGTIAGPQLLEDASDVPLDGIDRQEGLGRDLLVGQARGQERQD